jgi:leucyl aminopeptidase
MTDTATRPFSPTPSLSADASIDVEVAAAVPAGTTAVGVLVGPSGAVPDVLRTDRAGLDAAGFDGKVGSALMLPSSAGSVTVAVGAGEPDRLDHNELRNAAAAFARAAATHESLALSLPGLIGVAADVAAQVAVEGVLLARYRYNPLRREAKGTQLRRLVVQTEETEAVREGAERGRVFAAAEMLARDLSSTPHSHLTATRLGEIAQQLGSDRGFEVEVFDKAALIELGCGGLLAVNPGSVEPPLMIKVTHRPNGKPTGTLAMVGKGIMYDSGGISLKPSDMVHARMKNDMSGAASVLATVAALAELDSTTSVTGYLMCTDNMPSGSATALGDVFTARSGTTVEMIDTDAEGRVVMCDALALAAEQQPDAIVDIATLTGSCARALGPDIAGVFGNDQGLVDRVKAAADATDELVWQLPLHRPYRRILDSHVADIANCGPIGQPDAIASALYLAEFVGDVPWAHIDIAGTAWNDDDRSWKPAGATGFGTRLLVQLAATFTAPER